MSAAFADRAARPVASAARAQGHAGGPDPVELAVQVLADVAFIAGHWKDLLELRRPGTPRPWRQALLDPERRAAMAERDRLERATRDPDAPGFTSAPEHVDVLDVLVEAWVVLDELVGLVAAVNVHTAVPARAVRRLEDVAGMVAFVDGQLPASAAAIDWQPFTRLSRQLASLTGEVGRVLSLVRAGQLLTGAVCPWCRGVTPKHPAGGATTLRVEELPGSQRMGTEPVAAVVCWNAGCSPDGEACGTWWRGRPAWPQHEWDWLAERLIVADPPVLRAPPPIDTAWVEGVPIQPVDHSGRSGRAQT